MKLINMRGMKYGILAVMLLVFSICFAGTPNGVAAKNTGYSDSDFSISCEPGVSNNQSLYALSVEVYNGGHDFQGKIRLTINSAPVVVYDIPITLPEKSTKNFNVEIPLDAIAGGNSSKVTVAVSTEDDDIIKAQTYVGLFNGNNDATIKMGVLSDSYSKLTYLDLSGNTIYYKTDNYYIGLVELNADNVVDNIDTLQYLVIDDFDSKSLSQDTIDSIDNWVQNGGSLIIGTGKNKNLSTEALPAALIEATVSPQITTQGTLDNGYADGEQIDLAQISYNGSYYNWYSFAGNTKSTGNGSVTLLEFALSDSNVSSMANINDCLDEIYRMAYESTNYVQTSNVSYYSTYGISSAYGVIEGNTSFSTVLLNLIIIVYVILIGPVTYLVLKSMNKRELCWVVIPATTVLFLGIVFFAGRGFRVSGNRGYTITAVDCGTNEMAKSYMGYYTANAKEWDVLMKENVKYAGTLNNGNTYAGSGSGDYNYKITTNPNNLTLSYVPNGGFDFGYFMMISERPTVGKLEFNDIDLFTRTGTVTNNTGRNLSNILVYDDGNYCYYGELKNGETLNISTATELDNGTMVDPEHLVYYVGEDLYDDGKYDDAGNAAAMYFPMCSFFESNMTCVMGTTSYDSIIASPCDETSRIVIYNKSN